jgi:pSer/pThr/pTyr-binding forkhead associated (FHA) protein
LGLLESIRKWIDGEANEDLLEAAGEHAKPRRVWEEFLVKIAREVESVMQQEMFTPPGGPTYIPREYIVYLSTEDDKEWQGDKRRGLEQGLFHVLSERAHELSGQTQLAAKSFAVELRIDGTLKKGEFRVQAVWDESESGQTMVTPRLDPTMPIIPAGDQSVVTESEATEGEQTVVRVRPTVLYQVEIWRDSVRESVVPMSKTEITIGRGSRTVSVDLPLKGDPEVSRVHATLALNNEGKYWIIAKGRNPTFVNGQEIPRGEPVEVSADQKIAICGFVLRIQPK